MSEYMNAIYKEQERIESAIKEFWRYSGVNSTFRQCELESELYELNKKLQDAGIIERSCICLGNGSPFKRTRSNS
jgi:hypothetical protein